ncbi:uncharacterized protein LOC110449116, partial [Mizuhopecten yessoensis]|uniref:uncharacterized protein LOC110449116 n=1 Tax=Mizuhopecten yessoensis TaxID=6573 RepID=UPI000B45F0D7
MEDKVKPYAVEEGPVTSDGQADILEGLLPDYDEDLINLNAELYEYEDCPCDQSESPSPASTWAYTTSDTGSGICNMPSNADSVIQREEQPAARPVATPEPPIGLLHPPSRELEEDHSIPSNADSVIQREEQPAARPVATPEPPIGLLHPPSRELEEDHSIPPDTTATTTPVTAPLPVIRRRRLRLHRRREPTDTSYTDIDTPGEVSIRRSSAIRARETIRQNARVIMSGEETPSTEGNQTPEMSPLLLDITDSPTRCSTSAQGSLSRVSPLQAALDRLDAVFSDTQQVTVRRDHVFEDLMDLYKDPGVLQHRLGVTFAGESGEDAGGLTKDLFSTFWEQACSRLFTGEDVLVPHLPPHRFSQASTIYPVLGRILCHGLALTKGFPLQICRTVLISTALGQIAEDKKIILEDFLLFVSEHERALTWKGLDSFTSLTSDELSQLTNMFARFSMSVMPTQDNFRRHIENLAACELTGKPLFLCQLMGLGIPEIYKDVFFHQVTQGDLLSLCERLTPTPSRVIGLLKTENDLLRPEEER